ncbi:RNA polymerase sigma-70 factor [Sunxiuqinia indica]|uniref:RNA polymerase sigma-70 factor n=1 Tax=Sunxiuqinia indica TaxID=2692584 RepID=UPI00135C1993|nr:RNA polymerase sigma-70 factor [Sunxiuqinia indica]
MKADINSRLKVGDADAFEDIFKLTHPRLLSYCRLFVPDLSLSDDLVQECFMSLWEKRKTIKPNQSVESLLFVMLRHRCLNYLRDNKFLYSETEIQNVKEVDLQHLFELDFTGIERKSIEEELIDAITVEIEKLPEKRKEVFVKSKIEGLKNKEVAEQLGISIKTVEKHLKQAKEQIRREILDKYPMMAFLIAVILK